MNPISTIIFPSVDGLRVVEKLGLISSFLQHGCTAIYLPRPRESTAPISEETPPTPCDAQCMESCWY